MKADKQPHRYLFMRVKNDLHRIDYELIAYIQAEGNYCYVMTVDGGKYTTKISLRQLLTHLPEDQFIRIHKSYVVNLAGLVKINTKEREAHLKGVSLPIGRTYLSALTDRIMIL